MSTTLAPSTITPGAAAATTATALQALTTPFVQRPECASVWDLTSVSLDINGTATTVTILASDAADARFAACQPSGWDNAVPTERFAFSPAVCPSGWTYYFMAATKSYSTAFCCTSGHSLRTDLHAPISTMMPPCYRHVADGATTITVSHGNGSTGVFTQGIQMHQAWRVTWAASDTSTLSPSLPWLTSSMFVPSWIPGEEIPRGLYDQNGSYNDMRGFQGLLIVVIAVPLVFATLIPVCIWRCVRHKRLKWREKEWRRGRQLREKELNAVST